MDEIIVRVFRALACVSRLRILSCLSRVHEATPTQLARLLGMRLNVVCTHLQRLTSAGLISRRRSGVWCYCRARSPYPDDVFSGKLTSWLRRQLRGSGRTRAGRGRRGAGPEAHAELQRVIFDAATTFTNVRRLQILRRLTSGGAVPIRNISEALRMSESAASRHLAKLTRRGYVESAHAGRQSVCRLARKCKTPVHRKLLEIVLAEWGKR